MRLDVRGVKCRAVPIDQAGFIGCLLHHLEQALPRAIARPAHKPIVTGLPRTVARRDVAPTRSGAQAPQDAIDHAPMLDISMATMWIGRQMGFQLPPLLFGKVSSAHRRLTILV